MRHIVLLIGFAAAALGRHLSFSVVGGGVVGGGSVTDAFPIQNVPTGSASLPFDRLYSSSKDWIVGGRFTS